MAIVDDLGSGGRPGVQPAGALAEEQWRQLLRRIKIGQCTPFIGPGACDPLMVPPPWKIAEEWSSDAECPYPLEDTSNMPRVAQYRTTNGKTPHEDLYWDWHCARLQDSKDEDDIHRCLASLPFSVYISTHYFDFLTDALRERRRDPRRDFCRWRDEPAARAAYGPSVFDEQSGYDPSPANPLVYHLYGCLEKTESVVLTEDDYLDFLVHTSGDAMAHTSERSGKTTIPPVVEAAMANKSLLFLGYQLNDLDFRVLLRKLVCSKRIADGMHLSVQMVAVSDSSDPEEVQQLQSYVDKYLARLKIGVCSYPGSLRAFAVELRQRWEDFDAKTPRI